MYSNGFRTPLWLIILLITASCNTQKKELHTSNEFVSIRVNGEVAVAQWKLAPELDPDVFELECREPENIVTFSDGKDSVTYIVKQGSILDFDILLNQKDTAKTRIIGIAPNVNFSQAYIDQNRGVVNVAVPEVSELANILVALHKDAEKDHNMTHSNTPYFKRVKEHFGPYLAHPILDTIEKYIHTLTYNESFGSSLFSQESYDYYYALKMNACCYSFAADGQIQNDGVIREMAKGWNAGDPMIHADLMADFAEKSKFRAFYRRNLPYYDSLIRIYKRLNPVDRMQTWLEDKFGFSYGNYSIYFSPLVYGAHSTQKFSDNNFKQTFMFICPAEYDEEYSEILNEMFASRVVFTEIDHNYVNPISDKYLENINEAFGERETWAQGEITNRYESPYDVFNEYMTYAVYSLYLADSYEREDLLEFLPYMENQMEQRRGFIRFGAFNSELLKKYEENKTESIEQLYEHMLDWAVRPN